MKYRIAIVAVILTASPFPELLDQASAQDTSEVAGYQCNDCHTSESWDTIRPTGFSHESTNFPLKGQHKLAACSSCHKSADTESVHNFSEALSDCFTCHQDIHEDQLGSGCEECHNVNSWRVQSAQFDHTTARFTLLGPHRAVACRACHETEGNYSFLGLPLDCFGCHRDDYEMSESPAHVAAKISTDCRDCHPVQTSHWLPSIFNHDETSYGLSGAHSSEPCESCHMGIFVGTPVDCYDCHTVTGLATTVYESIESFDHVSHALPTNCTDCHTTETWSPTTFDHIDYTSSSCETCHTVEYDNTTNPPHITAELGTDCERCHLTNEWSTLDVDHDETPFPLSGAHASLDCNICHENHQYDVAFECYGCHVDGGIAETTYENAASYDHATRALDGLHELSHGGYVVADNVRPRQFRFNKL